MLSLIVTSTSVIFKIDLHNKCHALSRGHEEPNEFKVYQDRDGRPVDTKYNSLQPNFYVIRENMTFPILAFSITPTKQYILCFILEQSRTKYDIVFSNLQRNPTNHDISCFSLLRNAPNMTYIVELAAELHKSLQFLFNLQRNRRFS